MEYDVNSRTAILETNDKNIFHQLTDIRDELRQLHRLTAAYESIAAKTASVDERLGQIEQRLMRVEQAPAEDLRHYRRTAVACLVSAFISALCAGVFALLTI